MLYLFAGGESEDLYLVICKSAFYVVKLKVQNLSLRPRNSADFSNYTVFAVMFAALCIEGSRNSVTIRYTPFSSGI
jgi:hypothetical protein